MLTAVESNATTLRQVLQGGSAVYAVTSLGDDVFVMRSRSQQVEVYDAVTFTLRQKIEVPDWVQMRSALQLVREINACMSPTVSQTAAAYAE